ncbi:MAG: type IV pilus modification protein PilV [Proteobacteria bacterium]|jgi:prepilin-type N-terminal cleavage/methylation domain-containing protein|nr:type IV pilus modification protein PilV [Pseudomonadota bacterium]
MTGKEKGFTLVEVLIAVMVLAIAFLSMYQMQAMAVRGNETANQVTIATMLAQDKMEEIRNTNYDDVTNLNFPAENYGMVPNFPQFRREVAVTENGRVKTVRVTVLWKVVRTFRVSVDTLLTQ